MKFIYFKTFSKLYLLDLGFKNKISEENHEYQIASYLLV
jgi:hypothetical protein